jgi:uncharacterized protein
MNYQRDFVSTLLSRLAEPQSRPQVLLGPRQVGKTTGALQVLEAWTGPKHFASADAETAADGRWLRQQWDDAKALPGTGRRLLVLDEVQKISGWAEAVKGLWDAELRKGEPLALCLLGSSAMLMARGLSESLAGRFELNRVGHWQYPEMKAAFGLGLDSFIFYGGYPGAAAYRGDLARWAQYVSGTLIEAALNKDVLALQPVEKPALLRNLFVLACEHAGESLSYNKMLGQLTEPGSILTLARYQELLAQADLLVGLPKHSGSAIRRRASAPKWLPLNSALVTAQKGLSLEQWKSRPDVWGRLVEAAAGAHLWAECQRSWGGRLHWWREGHYEMDYVVVSAGKVLGIEVKSGRSGARTAQSLTAFEKAYPGSKTLLVGTGGMDLELFFNSDLTGLFKRVGL